MRVLWVGKNDREFLSGRLFYLRAALKKIADITEIGPSFPLKGRDMLELVKEHEPDIIFFRGGPSVNWEIYNPRWKNLHKVKVPKVLNYSDPQILVWQRVMWLNRNRIDMTLHAYRWTRQGLSSPLRDRFEAFKYMAFEGHKKRWLPPAADTEVHKDYKLDREYDIGLIGRISHLYPIRKKIWKTLRAIPDPPADLIPDFKIFYNRRIRASWGWSPKRIEKVKREKNITILMRESYARALSNCRIIPFCSSQFGYAVTKNFEVRACNTCAFTDMPGDGKFLHFEPGVDFVEINRENFMDKFRYYLENPSERKKIARAGFNLVQKYHTTDIRAQQMLEYFKELL